MTATEPLTKILVPLDFSIVSDKLLEYAAGIASRYGGELLLVHVIEESIIDHVAAGYNVTGIIEELEEKALAKLEKYQERAASLGVQASIYRDITVGDPAAVIAHIAQEESVSEVIVASKGWGMKRLIPLGSTARLLASLTPVPLIRVKAVKRNGTVSLLGNPDKMFNSILVGVDKVYSSRFIDYITALAVKTGATLTLVHVIEEKEEEYSGMLDGIAEKIGSVGVKVSRIVVSGKPYKRILEVADQLGVESIAVERRARRHVFREILLGSTLVNLLNKSDKPLIVVPEEQV